MPDGGGAAGEHQLAGNEVIVRDGVGGKVTQIPQPEGAEGVGGGKIVDLLPDVPVVTMAAQRRVMLRHGRIGGDVPIEKIKRKGAQQVGNSCRQK